LRRKFNKLAGDVEVDEIFIAGKAGYMHAGLGVFN
jgi:hypothetical protein